MTVHNLNNHNFKEILGSKGVSIVDFYADWCMPCKMMMPVVEEISKTREDIIVGKVNVSENTELASIYNVMSIPTLVVFKNGEEFTRSVGYRSKSEIMKMIE